MSKTSETGHATNVANLETLISSVLSFGTTYNPSRTGLKLEALQMVHATAKESLHALYQAQSAYTKAIDEREIGFKPLKVYITRINNALKASDSNAKIDESVQTIIRKLQGRRCSKKITEEEKKILEREGKEVHQISTSQMSYDMRLDNLQHLIIHLSKIPEYNPNEIDLTLETIKACHNQLKTQNSNVVTTHSLLVQARDRRNEILYHPLSGLVDIASDTKTYIKSVFGVSSPQYKQISKLQFINHFKYKR